MKFLFLSPLFHRIPLLPKPSQHHILRKQAGCSVRHHIQLSLARLQTHPRLLRPDSSVLHLLPHSLQRTCKELRQRELRLQPAYSRRNWGPAFLWFQVWVPCSLLILFSWSLPRPLSLPRHLRGCLHPLCFQDQAGLWRLLSSREHFFTLLTISPSLRWPAPPFHMDNYTSAFA